MLAEVATQRRDADAVARHLAETERHRGDWWDHTTGVDFLADASGALFWEDERLLVVSDLHLEKGSSFATRGRVL